MEYQNIRLAAGEIPYLEFGGGPDLLFLHGAMATSEAYMPLLTLLSERYHIVAPVHPGHGSALGVPRDWKLINIVQFYQEFFIEIGFTPTILMGHSFGGTLALLLASHGIGNRVIALSPGWTPYDFQIQTFAKAFASEAKQAMSKRSDLVSIAAIRAAVKTVAKTFIHHPDMMPLFMKFSSKMAMDKELRGIHVPVDLLWGEADQVVLLSVGRKLAMIIPNVSLTTFPDLGHLFCVLYPDFAYGELQKILNKTTNQ